MLFLIGKNDCIPTNAFSNAHRHCKYRTQSPNKTKMNKANIGILLVCAMPASLSAGVDTPAAPSSIHETTQSDWTCGLGVGTQVSTQGVGLRLTYNLNPSIYLALEGNYFEYSDFSREVDGVDYNAEFDASNLGLTLNYLPIEGSGFRLTGGVFISNNEGSGKADGLGQSVELDNTTYILGAGDSLGAEVEYNTVYPYVGIGWDWTLGASQNYILGVDLGVTYLGEPDATLTGTGVLFAPGSPGASSLAAAQQDFSDAVKDFSFFPVLKISLTYRF
jgi:hypothetical protein